MAQTAKMTNLLSLSILGLQWLPIYGILRLLVRCVALSQFGLRFTGGLVGPNVRENRPT